MLALLGLLCSSCESLSGPYQVKVSYKVTSNVLTSKSSWKPWNKHLKSLCLFFLNKNILGKLHLISFSQWQKNQQSQPSSQTNLTTWSPETELETSLDDRNLLDLPISTNKEYSPLQGLPVAQHKVGKPIPKDQSLFIKVLKFLVIHSKSFMVLRAGDQI